MKLWSYYVGYLLLDRSSCFLLLRRSIAICSLLWAGSSTLAVMKTSDLDSSMICTLKWPIGCFSSSSCWGGIWVPLSWLYFFSSSAGWEGIAASL